MILVLMLTLTLSATQPTPLAIDLDDVEITADDVYRQQRINEQDQTERSIRRDFERNQNWSGSYDDDDDSDGY